MKAKIGKYEQDAMASDSTNKRSDESVIGKFTNNTNVGTATVKFTGTGNYTGTVTRTFVIKPKATTVSKAAYRERGLSGHRDACKNGKNQIKS